MTTTPTNNPVPSNSPLDLKFNAEKMDQVINSPSLEYTDRRGNQRKTLAGFEYDLDQTRLNLVPLGKQYISQAEINADIASGVIPSGSYFWMRSTSPDTLAEEYYNNAGTPVRTGRRMDSQGRTDSIVMSVGLEVSQPNLFSNDVSDTKVLPPYRNATGALEITSRMGVPCFRLTTNVGSVTESGVFMGNFPASSFPGTFLSGSMLILGAEAATGTASGVRVVVLQYDSAGAEIVSARRSVVVTTTEAVTVAQYASLAAIPKDAACASVSLFLGVTTGSTTATRSVWYRDLMLADGSNATFRRAPLQASTTAQAIQAIDTGSFLSPAAAATAADQKLLSALATNLMPVATFESVAENAVPPGWTNAVVSTVGGVKCLRTPAATVATPVDGPVIDVSSLAGKHFSASVDIERKVGNQGVTASGLNNLRLRIIARDTSGNIINSAWAGVAGNDDTTVTGQQYYTRDVPLRDITEPYRINIARNLAIPAGAVSLQLNIRVENNGSNPAPNMYLNNFVLVNAPDAVMLPGKLNRDPVFPGVNNSSWITEAMASAMIQRKAFWNDTPNWFTDSQMKNVAVGAIAPGWQLSPKAVLKSGYVTLEFPAANTVSAVGSSLLPGFDVNEEKFPSGIFSAGVDIMEKIGDQGILANGLNNLRVRLIAVNASGAMIQNAWVGAPGNDDPTVTGYQYYTRSVTRDDIKQRTRIVIAEGLKIPSGTARIQFNIRAEGFPGAPCPQMYATNWSLRNGPDPSWIPEASGGTTAGAVFAYMSPTGSDSNSGLTLSSPLKTLAAAVAKISGNGTVLVAAGAYDYANFNVPFSAISNVRIQGVTTSAFEYPVVRAGRKLTGITKTAGRSRIYQAALTGYATGTHPSWLWIDDLPDADTLEQPENYHPAMRGRPNRLECTKIWLADTVRNAIQSSPAVAWDLNTALTEMDASNSPRCAWHEASGTVYFTMPDGADATATTYGIYAVVTNQRLFTGAGTQFVTAGSSLSISGARFRYCSVDTWAFRESFLNDVVVLGAAENCFDIGNWCVARNCKAAGSGSNNFLGTFDGYNMHSFSVFTHYDCWATDCLDDGWSSHENCTEIGYSPYASFNLGSGLTPAYGAEALYVNPYTRGNALQLRKMNVKRAGIESHQGPIATDPGVATVVMVKGGLSVDDYNGYVSGDTSGAPNSSNLVAIDCKAINPVQYGYRCTKIIDCDHGGTGQAKSPNTKIIVSTTRITS